MSLVRLIDEALEFVRAHPDEMCRADVDRLNELSVRAYHLAMEVGVAHSFPQVPELAPELQDSNLPPIQYVTKFNLPGDWAPGTRSGEDNSLRRLDVDALHRLRLAPNDDLLLPPSEQDDDPCSPPDRVFLVAGSPRWFIDMETLRGLTETKPATAPKQSLDVQALALLLADPTRKIKEIAKLLNRPTQSLAPKRCPKLHQAMAARRSAQAPPRGSKGREGNLEAWDDENDS